MAKVHELAFGCSVAEGRKYHRDILICAGSTLKNRDLPGGASDDAVARLNELIGQKTKVAALIHIAC